MKANKNLYTLEECFNSILKGDKEKSALASLEVRKILYKSNNATDYKTIKRIVNNAPRKYQKIAEDWRKVYFVRAISVIYFLRGRENEPDLFFPWLFELLKHPNGTIRYATVRMFENEIGPLTAHIRCREQKSFQSRAERSNRILRSLVIGLKSLLTDLGDEKYDKYEFVGDLPVCPYKSAQMVFVTLVDHLGEDAVYKLFED